MIPPILHIQPILGKSFSLSLIFHRICNGIGTFAHSQQFILGFIDVRNNSNHMCLKADGQGKIYFCRKMYLHPESGR
jgi:hypothetical protein